MELTNGRGEGGLVCGGDRILPQIGVNHQVTMPPLKQSARIASLEFINRDQWFACGLPIPIMHIAASPSWRKGRSSAADQDKSWSLASTSNSRSNGVQPVGGGPRQQIPFAAEAIANKDANSCASSSKETCRAWKKEESSPVTLGDAAFLGGPESAEKALAMEEDQHLPGVSGQSELKSSITSVAQGGSSPVMKKRKKRRSCWQTLKRKGGNKKSKIEKGKIYKRWSGSLCSEFLEEGQGSGGRVGAREEGRGRVVPGGQPDSWSKEEVAGFTLALYLFDKDFCAIRRFLETKKMQELVHFYYGKFYGTPAFSRWAGSKNSRNRKFVHGPRILQGWRQDELLRRLLPHFSDAAIDVIPEAVKAFNDRELTVEGFAAELKAAAGLDVLVDCVGVGVSKRDLTAVHCDPARHGNSLNHLGGGGGGGGGGAALVESATGAAGKACSTLTRKEMLDYLTGDFRISKTRAQDLFWEAVWPRLLNLGWHSIECETPGFPGSKNPLLFLRPGVTKIARGSSERGLHYFSSVSEVLKAVADDPGLLDRAGDELTGDTMEGSENQEDEDEQEEEWSDDMYETLDMHRLKGPIAGKTSCGAGVKNAKAAYKAASSPCPSPSPCPSDELAAQDSSESSSVDIDLNRPLSAVSSKSPECPEEVMEDVDLFRTSAPAQATVSHRHRFIEEIDLNLPPLDLDFNSPVGTTKDDGEVHLELQTAYRGATNASSSSISKPADNVEVLDCKTWDPYPVSIRTVLPASLTMDSLSVMETINLNDPLPAAEMMMHEAESNFPEKSRLGGQEEFTAGSSGFHSIWPVGWEVLPFDRSSGASPAERPQSLKSASCSCGFPDSCKCQPRKWSLSHQEDEAAARGVNHGKELISASKKRFKKPFRLNGLHTPNFIFSMHVATMNSWAGLGIQSLPRASQWRQDWSLAFSPSVVEKFLHSTPSQLPKCEIVEVNGDMEAISTDTCAENQASEGQVQSSLTTRAPLVGQYGHVKRLRCHFSESEAPTSPSYHHLRSKLQRQPRKYTISFDSRSGRNRLPKARERCSDWSWPRDGRVSKNVVDSTSCCSTSREVSSAASPDGQCPMESSQQEGVKSETYDDSKENDYSPRRKIDDGENLWKTTSGPRRAEGDAVAINHSKSLPRDWKVPCLTLTAPGDSCDFYGFRQMQRTRGIRTHGRLHHAHRTKSSDSEFLQFSTGTKRFPSDPEDLDSRTKKIRMDTSNPLRSREEEDLVITLCNMQQQRLGGETTSGVITPKLKRKRSAGRSRRINFSYFPQFMFGGKDEEEEQVEEGLFLRPCTSQGPWQPTLPTTEKIARSPKLRRRRSDLPCRSSCVVAATSPGASGSKVAAGKSSKGCQLGQLGSRSHGKSAAGWEEAVAAWNWPEHDVRFSSLRRQLSEGSARTDRHIGRKVPARWNQYPVC